MKSKNFASVCTGTGSSFVRTGTAWAGADDGLLVLDRDGNGLIDSGRELFGNNTLLANGQKAADGYAALRELDANADGVLNASDAQFAGLKPYLDAIELVIDESGVGFDTAGLDALVAATHTVSERTAILDLGDLYRHAQDVLDPVGYDALAELRQRVAALPAGSPIKAELQAAGMGLFFGTALADALQGTTGDETFVGEEGHDTVLAGAGNDEVFGGLGNDTIDGGAGDDVIEGGEGNDTLADYTGFNILRGGAGNDTISGRGYFDGGEGDDVLQATDTWSRDTYYFRLGDGKDVIADQINNRSIENACSILATLHPLSLNPRVLHFRLEIHPAING
jgi:Ca2+-binding RTX toxin-like protein